MTYAWVRDPACSATHSKGSHLEHTHQLMQNFYKFAHLKSTFSILHSYFYKTLTSVCLLYTFIQIKYSSSNQSIPTHLATTINPRTQPPSSTHHHQPPSPQNLLIKQKIQNRKSIINHHQPLFLAHFLELLDSHRLDPSFFSLSLNPIENRDKKKCQTSVAQAWSAKTHCGLWHRRTRWSSRPQRRSR